MQLQIEDLAEKIVDAYRVHPPDRRLLLALGGPPGCGKSTIVDPLLSRVNFLLGEHDAVVAVSLDGWHYARDDLAGMSDPVDALWRRGAAFTFNLIQYRSFLESLAECVLDDRLAPEIHFPSFDHALKDPSPNPAPILARHRIILIEGLYVLYTRPGWADCATMMDIRVWIECEREVARGRIIKRHLRSGLFDDYENTAKRVDAVDMCNGEEVRRYRLEPTFIIHSIESA